MSSTVTSPELSLATADSIPAPRALPSAGQVFLSLFKADLTTQWRNRRASLMVVLLPVVIVMSWKALIARTGGAFVLANAATLGLNAIGLMGYPTTIAKDRDKDIFQRLRVAPAPGWTIMGSRLAVQLVMILFMIIVVFLVGYQYDNIVLPVTGYLAALLASIAGGAVYLGLGQAIVGRIRNAETVTSTCRLIYIAFIMVGMFGELHMLGKYIDDITPYTPYGTVKTIVSAAMTPAEWNSTSTLALFITLGYTAVFTYAGIRWFKWSTKS
ncbi:MAG TPA: ABC transporter permease [Puia sp.]|nr:ABC transporter permease [Puia sp.]